MHTCWFLNTEVLYSYRMTIINKWYFLILSTILYFLMLMNARQFYLLNWQDMCTMWALFVSLVYTGLLAKAFLQSHKINLTYYCKSSLLLAFCPLFVCMVDQTQMYPSSISPLGLFQVVMCNIKRPKWRTLEPELP